MTELVVKSEYLYRGKILNVRLDQVRLTDARKQRIVAREIVEHLGAVAIAAIDEKERVLLVKQFRSAVAQELLELPAGTLEPGEDPLRCAVRELKEETGYTAGHWEELGRFFPTPGFCTERMHLYLARNLTQSTPSPEDDESLEVSLVPLREAVSQIERGDIIDAKTIVGLLRVWKRTSSEL